MTIFGGPRASSLLNIPEARSLHHEYSSLSCAVEIVDDVNAAIDHIHQHGRHDSFSVSFHFFLVYLIVFIRKLIAAYFRKSMHMK